MLLRGLNYFSANTRRAKNEPGAIPSEVGKAVRSRSHSEKIRAEKAIGHWIAKMAKLFQYCSLFIASQVRQTNDCETVQRVQERMNTKRSQHAHTPLSRHIKRY
jgi:hypothetical protein